MTASDPSFFPQALLDGFSLGAGEQKGFPVGKIVFGPKIHHASGSVRFGSVARGVGPVRPVRLAPPGPVSPVRFHCPQMALASAGGLPPPRPPATPGGLKPPRTPRLSRPSASEARSLSRACPLAIARSKRRGRLPPPPRTLPPQIMKGLRPLKLPRVRPIARPIGRRSTFKPGLACTA